MVKKTASVFILALMFLLGSASALAQTRQETDNKVREMANETYVNRFFVEDDGTVKTSDKQQLVNEDETSFFTVILDFIGL